MEQMNIFDYIKKNVIVQKAPEKPTRSEQYEILDKKYGLSRKYKDEDGWQEQ